MLSQRISAVTLALVAAAVLGACGDDEDTPTGVGNQATVRFFNAISDDFAFDVANGGSVGSGNGNVQFGAASACTRVNAAGPALSIRPAGSTTNLPGFTASFTANNTYTVLVTGTDAAPVFSILNDQFTAPTTGNAAVRIVNATTTATPGGTWDIYVNPTATLGTPNATGIGRNAASLYLTVPAGQTNTIRLTNTGETDTVLDITVSSLTSGSVSTIVVTDAAAGTTALRTFTLGPCSTTT